jgi:hypothetical protein
MSSEKDDVLIGMTAETIAGDLISMLLDELRMLPDIWPKIGPDEQEEIIGRVRQRVTGNVRQAVHLIASEGRITVAGDLKKVLFADKVEALFALSKNDPAAVELTRYTGQPCLIVVANSGAHMGGADSEKAERQLALPGCEGDAAANAIIEQAKRRAQGPQNPPPASEPPQESDDDENDD